MSRRMLHMFVDDLTADERRFRACPEANCIDWLVGHLTLTEQRFHAVFDATSPALPAGFEARYARDDTAPRQADYGDTASLMAIFDEQRNVTIETVRALPQETLMLPLVKPHPRFSTLGEAAVFCALHVTMHAGQMSMIRRVLGKPPVI